MRMLFILPALALGLAGCQLQGFKTGPLSDPEVLAQRCAELNLAMVAASVLGKIDTSKAYIVYDAVCAPGAEPINDYPSTLNAIANALKTLRK